MACYPHRLWLFLRGSWKRRFGKGRGGRTCSFEDDCKVSFKIDAAAVRPQTSDAPASGFDSRPLPLPAPNVDARTSSQYVESLDNGVAHKELLCSSQDVLVPQAPELTFQENQETCLMRSSVEDRLPSREAGDLVRLNGCGTPAEFRGKIGIVVEAHETHCTVTLLSDDLVWGLVQLWPNNRDTELLDSRLRVGSRIILQNLRGNEAELNGKSGKIIRSKHNHPAFMKKLHGARLVVCVKLDEKLHGRASRLILEPRHLADEKVQTTSNLNQCGFVEALTNLQGIATMLSQLPSQSL